MINPTMQQLRKWTKSNHTPPQQKTKSVIHFKTMYQTNWVPWHYEEAPETTRAQRVSQQHNGGGTESGWFQVQTFNMHLILINALH